jgi:hypothetical protein
MHYFIELANHGTYFFESVINNSYPVRLLAAWRLVIGFNRRLTPVDLHAIDKKIINFFLKNFITMLPYLTQRILCIFFYEFTG